MNAPPKHSSMVHLLCEAGLAVSNSEATRLIHQGAVRVNGNRITDASAPLPSSTQAVVQVGKRRACVSL